MPTIVSGLTDSKQANGDRLAKELHVDADGNLILASDQEIATGNQFELLVLRELRTISLLLARSQGISAASFEPIPGVNDPVVG